MKRTSMPVPSSGGAGHLLRHQLVPAAAKRLVNPHDRGEQDIDLARLDLLDGANIEIHLLRQTLLRDGPSHPLTAHVSPEGSTFFGAQRAIGHAPLGRTVELTNTAHWGVNVWIQPEPKPTPATRASEPHAVTKGVNPWP